MNITIARVHENVFSGEALSLSAKTTDGDVTILPNHEPYVANLAPGVVTIHTKEGRTNFEVSGGILEVSNDHVTVLL